MKNHKNIFVPKRREYMLQKKIVEELVQERKMTWKKLYGLLPDDEVRKDEEEEADEVELDNKED